MSCIFSIIRVCVCVCVCESSRAFYSQAEGKIPICASAGRLTDRHRLPDRTGRENLVLFQHWPSFVMLVFRSLGLEGLEKSRCGYYVETFLVAA